MTNHTPADRLDERRGPAGGSTSRGSGDGTFGLLVVAGLLAGLAVLVIGLVAAGGAPKPLPAGFSGAGTGVAWAVPVLRLISDLAAITTAGAVLAAAVLLKPKDDVLDGTGVRAVQDAAMAAGVWAVAAVLQLFATASVIVGVPLASLGQYAGQAGAITQVRMLAVSVVVASIVAIVLSGTKTVETARIVLVLIGIALTGPLLTGHGAIERTALWSLLATSSLVVHVLAATTWIGGLAGLVRYGRFTVAAVERFSRIAFGCVLAIGVTGLLTAEIHLGGRDDGWGLITQWVTTGYGALVFAKAVAFTALVAVGWWHRRRTLPELAAGRPGAFWRLVVVELLLMAATVGLAVALSRTP